MRDLVETPAQLAGALAVSVDMAEALQAIARYGLASREQHAALLECPGLVQAVVAAIASCQCVTTQQADQPALRECDCREAALETASSLAISSSGREALIQAGAVSAASSTVVQAVVALSTAHPCKKQRTHSGAHPAPASDPDDDEDVLALAVQLLAALLLQPSGARPAVGSLLTPQVAAETACALLEMLPRPCWQLLPTHRLQLDAVAVLMRLAMEPGVVEVLCQQQAPDPTVCATSSARNAADPPQHSAQHAAVELSSLLGLQCAEQQFFSSHWEAEPLLCRAPQSARLSNPPSTAPPQQLGAGHSCGGPHALLQLTPAAVVQQLSQHRHCPVLQAGVLDPVQVLHDLREQGQLLQPLKLNSDLRLIKTQQQPEAEPHTAPAAAAAASTAVGAWAAAAGAADPGAAAAAASAGPPRASAPQEVLYNSSSSSSAGVAGDCLSALQSGFTVVLRDIPKRHLSAALLCEALEAQLGLPAGANLYLTPAGSQGLQAHYDDHCVWVWQLSGSKRWSVGPPQHATMLLPLAHQQRLPVVPPDQFISPAGQPEAKSWPQQLVLHAGDCLYLPRGWVHQAVAFETAAAARPAAGATPSPAATGDGCIQAGVLAGSSLHLSVGVEVAAGASIQDCLHYLIEFACSDAARVGGTASCCHCDAQPSSANLNQQHQHPQQLQPLAVKAAALLLHVQLWCQAVAHPGVYRRACPALAAGDAATALAAAALDQLQQAHNRLPAAAAAQSQAGQQQPHAQWVAYALQQLLLLHKPDGFELSELVATELLSLQEQQSGQQQPDSQLSLADWLEAAARPSDRPACSACGSSCCHSAAVCAAAVLLLQHDDGSVLQQHVAACACCQQQAAGEDSTLLRLAALQLPAACAAVAGALTCAACQAAALREYQQAAAAQLASCQAVRRAFVVLGG